MVVVAKGGLARSVVAGIRVLSQCAWIRRAPRLLRDGGGVYMYTDTSIHRQTEE